MPVRGDRALILPRPAPRCRFRGSEALGSPFGRGLRTFSRPSVRTPHRTSAPNCHSGWEQKPSSAFPNRGISPRREQKPSSAFPNRGISPRRGQKPSSAFPNCGNQPPPGTKTVLRVPESRQSAPAGNKNRPPRSRTAAISPRRGLRTYSRLSVPTPHRIGSRNHRSQHSPLNAVRDPLAAPQSRSSVTNRTFRPKSETRDKDTVVYATFDVTTAVFAGKIDSRDNVPPSGQNSVFDLRFICAKVSSALYEVAV